MENGSWIGRKFGKLTVEQETGTPDRGSCLCRCECGKTKWFKKGILRAGHAKTCGCSGQKGGKKKQDLTGQKFGRLTVLQMGEKNCKDKCFCSCECGNKKWINYDSIVHGLVNSCGCIQQEMYEKRTKPIRVGDRFGRLVIVEIYKENGIIMCDCDCDCGETAQVAKGNLVRKEGGTKSCGCLLRESKPGQTHGLDKERLYRICRQAVDRVTKLRKGSTGEYFGIGIEPEWAKDPVVMYYDLKSMYDKHVEEYGEYNTTIDRINNANGYFRDNVCFATRKEQEKNKGPRKDQYCFMIFDENTGNKYCCNNINYAVKVFDLHVSNVHGILSGRIKGTHKGFWFDKLNYKCYDDNANVKLESKWKNCLNQIIPYHPLARREDTGSSLL